MAPWDHIIWAPMVAPLWIVCACGALCLVAAIGVWFGHRGALWRMIAAGVIAVMLMGPTYRQETRVALPDNIAVIVDRSASARLGTRDQIQADLRARLEAIVPETAELRLFETTSADQNGATHLAPAVQRMSAEIDPARLAAVVFVSDGQVADIEAIVGLLPAGIPVHLLLATAPNETDPALEVVDLPRFAIAGEEITATLRVRGASSGGMLKVWENDTARAPVRMAPDQDTPIPLRFDQAGEYDMRFEIPAHPGELTDRNNHITAKIHVVRDKLRVLLVSGLPHAGGRSWRNLLKSDAAVDLVHFTILRPQDKHDGVPQEEMALIAFPVHELFQDKITDFDLIIFDRYKWRGLLPMEYFENIANFARQGGAVLVVAGPDFASAQSLARSPLGDVLPVRPKGQVLETPFVPKLAELGARHPITRDLPDAQNWGQWLHQVAVQVSRGQVVMHAGDNPLLVLDTVEKGRVAVLASDQIWLWSRGYDGGGPDRALLRNIAHWLMRSPEMAEETLTLGARGDGMRITRRSLRDHTGAVILGPDGRRREVALLDRGAGRFVADVSNLAPGRYVVQSGEMRRSLDIGRDMRREFAAVLADETAFAPLVSAHRGAVLAAQDLVWIKPVRAGRIAAGRDWIGYTPRNASALRASRHVAVVPGWLGAVLALGALVMAWRREGRFGA